jgi:hypothetical protein
MAESGDEKETPTSQPPPIEWGWDDWPQGCPPPDAVDAGGIVYRVVRNSPPRAADFLPRIKDIPALTGKISGGQLPKYWGISLHDSPDDAAKLRDQKNLKDVQDVVPGTRKWRVAKGELQSAFGKMKATPKNGDSHRD